MNQTAVTFSAILNPYKIQVEQLIRERIERDFGAKTTLRDACEYALMNGGKRFRPALVLMIAKALGKGFDVADAALGVEYFHTASLIADDLPCMDDDDERRNKPSLHKVYGESVALLASYALIAAGYESLVKNTKIYPDASQSAQLCVLGLENAAHNTGILGATGGQLLDLYPVDDTLESYFEIIDKKTVTLFEISFVYGWIFGGGDVSRLGLVKSCAAHFGRAFQIADDIGDCEQDRGNGAPNLANSVGLEKAMALFKSELELFEEDLGALGLRCEDLQALVQMLVCQANS